MRQHLGVSARRTRQTSHRCGVARAANSNSEHAQRALTIEDLAQLVLAIEKEFGVKIGSSEESRLALGSVNTLAAYLGAHSTGV